jgi:predicted RNase H-like nuclease (RuvC/YqgF family)
MNENEQVLETFIKQQQDMINNLSQQNIMLNTKINYLEEKLKDFDKYDKIIKDLRRDKIRLERKVESLTNNNKALGDRIRNGKDELNELQKVLEQKKLINKTSISGFSHTGKIQRK